MHNAYIQKFLQEVNVHGKSDRHMRLLMIETEIRLVTLWDQEECNMTVEGSFSDDRTSVFPPSCCRGCGGRVVGFAAVKTTTPGS